MNSTKQYMNSTNSAWTVNPCEVTVHVQKKKKKKEKKRKRRREKTLYANGQIVFQLNKIQFMSW